MKNKQIPVALVYQNEPPPPPALLPLLQVAAYKEGALLQTTATLASASAVCNGFV